MKKLFFVLCLIPVLLTGCGKKDEVSMEANAICVTYVTQMKAGKTTPEQDRQFIESVSKVTYELDRAIRGTKKAEATRLRAETMSTTGVDPKSPLDLVK